jgi:hypothetical protein
MPSRTTYGEACIAYWTSLMPSRGFVSHLRLGSASPETQPCSVIARLEPWRLDPRREE